jgi:hypothetical protein
VSDDEKLSIGYYAAGWLTALAVILAAVAACGG